MRPGSLPSRLSALAILVTLAAGFWLLLPNQWLDLVFAHRASILHSQELLARYRHVELSQTMLRANLQQLDTSNRSEARLLSAGSPQLAGADLQNKLKTLIDNNDAALTSMQVLPVRAENKLKRISLLVSFSARLKTLVPILYAIETQQPYLFVEDLELRRNEGIDHVDDKTNDLQVQFTVVGYMAGDKS